MAALSGANVTSLRAGGHRAKTYLSVAPDSTVATARVNQSSFTRPLAELTVDTTSDWSDVQPGMSAWIGTTAGARDIGVWRVRKTPGATTLYINEMSTGDTGLLPLSILQPFSDNAYVTIKKDFNAWSVFSKITYSGGVDARSGTFAKDYDIAYDDHNSTEPHCPINLGEHRAGFISGGSISFDFTATAAPFVGTVASYLWDVDGASITSGTSADQSITVQFSEGFYVVSCTVTLSTGKAMTGYRAVFAHGSTLTPLDIQITSDRRDIYGRRVQFRTRQDVDDLRTGNFVLLWHDMSWGGDDIATASKQFTGWTREITDTAQRANREHSFEMISGLETLKEAVAFGQQLVVALSPASWAEVSSSLATLDYWLFYLLHYHTTLLKLFDIELSGLTDTTQTWSVSTGDIHQQLNQSAERQDCAVGQAGNGTLYVRQDPIMMDETDRDAVAERMTITDADLLEPATMTHILRPKAYAVEAGSFDYSGGTLTAYLSKAPGNVGTQGKSAPKLTGRIGDQTAINLISANALAKENNPYGAVNLTLGGLYDVFEPSTREWVRVTLSADYSPTGAAFNERCLIKTMNVQYLDHGHRRVSLVLDVETGGYDTPGETQPIRYPDSGNAGLLSGTTLINFPAYDLTSGLLALPHYPFDDYDLPYPESVYEDTSSDYAFVWSNA